MLWARSNEPARCGCTCGAARARGCRSYNSTSQPRAPATSSSSGEYTVCCRTAATGRPSRRRAGRAGSSVRASSALRLRRAIRRRPVSRSPATPTARATRSGRPAFNVFQVYGRMAAERNDFNINLGDTIYSDSEVGGGRPRSTVPAKWAKYRLGLALPLSAAARGRGLYSHWDDHEFVNDFTRAEHGERHLSPRASRPSSTTRPVTYTRRERPLPHVPLGQAPRALLPRRALVPQRRRSTDGLRRRPCPTAPQPVPRRVRGARPALAQSGRPGLPRRDRRSGADDARRPPATRRSAAIRASTATFKVDRQRGAAAAVLRAALRPLGGLRGRARHGCSTPRGRTSTSSSSRPTRTRT